MAKKNAAPTQQALDALAARVSFLEGAVSMLKELLCAQAPASSVGSFASNDGLKLTQLSGEFPGVSERTEDDGGAPCAQ